MISDNFIQFKSIIRNGLANIFSDMQFVEIHDALNSAGADFSNDIDYPGDVDYLGYVGEKAFGIQIKPTTAKANFGNYSISERMQGSFAEFTENYSGKVFIIFSLDGKIGNPEIIPEIAEEIARLRV